MCGIVGIWDSRDNIKKDIIIRMRDALIHRGPDSEGLFISKSGKTALGFRRLSIIDLSISGNQPIPNEDKTKWIVFNGEVYNYKELHKRLEESGHRFRSNGDTEVILHSYEEFGCECIEHFQGMFGFAIWDENRQQFFLARDRFGIKPLYYYFDGSVFLFASEIKALLEHPAVVREIDYDAFDDYLTYGYVPYDKAIIKNIHKVPAGHYLVFENANVTVKKYWSLQYAPKERTENQIVEELSDMIYKAVKLWTVSDVTVGTFLSGGLDSSAVCAMMTKNKNPKVNTFAIGFDKGRSNETDFARIVANEFHTDHNEQIVSVDEAKTIIPLLPQIYDEPFADTSSVPTFYVSKFTRKKVKVALTGDGGDEVFFGYGWYKEFLGLREKSLSHTAEVLANTIINGLRGFPFCARIAALEKYTTSDQMKRYFRIIGYFDDWEKQKLLNNMSSDKDFLWLFRKFFNPELPLVAALRILDVNTYLVDDILTKVDRASMANSLEARTPLLEHKLAEFVMTIPVETIYKNEQRKYIFKQAMHGVLPDSILKRSKRGFSAPIIAWLQSGLWDYAYLRIINGYAVKDGVINSEFISSMMRNFTKKRWAKIWLLLMFEEWYRRWIHNIVEHDY